MASTDPIYKINNKEVPASTLKTAAEQNGVTLEEYLTKRGAVLVPGKTTDSTITNPNVESGNTELDAENGSAGSEPTRYIEFNKMSLSGDKLPTTYIFEDDYNSQATDSKTFDEYALSLNRKIQESLPEIVITATPSEQATKAKDLIKKQEAAKAAHTPSSSKEGILINYFNLEENPGWFNDTLTPTVQNRPLLEATSGLDSMVGETVYSTPSEDYYATFDKDQIEEMVESGELKYENDYEIDLKKSLGEQKYAQWKSIEKQAGNKSINSDNIKNLFNLDEALRTSGKDSAIHNSTNQVLEGKRKTAMEIVNRDSDPSTIAKAQVFASKNEDITRALAEEEAKRFKDARDYKSKTGKVLLGEKTIYDSPGRTRTYVAPDTGAFHNKGYKNVLEKFDNKIKEDYSDISEKANESVAKKLKIDAENKIYNSRLSPILDAYKKENDPKIKEDLRLQYNAILEEDGFVSLMQSNKDLATDQVYINSKIESISKLASDFSDTKKVSASLAKSYAISDRLALTLEESFLGTTAMMGTSVLKGIGDVVTLGGTYESDLYDDLVSLKGAAVNYNRKLQDYRSNMIPDALSMDDESSSVTYLSEMLVNNSPSILVALGTMGTTSIAAAGLTGLARAQTAKQVGLIGEGIFFNMGYGGQLASLEVAQQEASELVKRLKSDLKNPNIDPIEKESILKQIEEQSAMANLSQFQKSLNSFAYGQIERYAEKMGTLNFMSNFDKMSGGFSKKLLAKYGTSSVKRAVSKSIGAVQTGLMGMKGELIEEGVTSIGQSIMDITMLGQDKSLIDGLDGEFVANTLATSLAIQGPQISQNIYSAVNSEIKTSSEARKERGFRDELMSIQKEINLALDSPVPEKGSLEAGKIAKLYSRRNKVIKESAIFNAEITAKLANMSGGDIEQVFDNNSTIRVMQKEANSLGAELDVSDFGKKRIKELNDKANNLLRENSVILGKNKKEIEALYKKSADPVTSAYNHGVFQFSSNIAGSVEGVSSYEFENKSFLSKFLDKNIKEATLSEEAVDKLNPKDKSVYENKINELNSIKEQTLEGYDSGFNAANVGNDILIFKDNVIATFTNDSSSEGTIAAMSPMHELGHIQTRKAGIIKNDAVVGDAALMVESILADVKSKADSGKLSKENYDLFKRRLDAYTNNEKYKDTNGVDADELIQLVSDFTAIGLLTKSSFTELTSIKLFTNSLLKHLNKDASMFFRIDSPTDVYNFISSWQKKAASMSLTGEDEEESTVKASKTVLNEINDLVPLSVKTQADYFSPKVFNPIYKATQPNGVISNYIKSKSPSKEVGEKAIAGIQDRLVNYDPAAERKKAGNKEPITFGEFIFANTNFIKLDAKKALFKESEAAKKTTDLDTKEAQGKIAEDDVVKKDRPKFRKLIDSGVLPGFTIKEIGGKLTKVLKVLKSKLDTKVSINKSVSPLIAEIKKAMGKQADIDLKEAMGGKADAKLQKWLLKNKKAVLENMTTTWLMGAIPQAIQKSVGGTYKVDDAGTRVKDSYGDFIFTPNFTSDWQGKTIDREKTSTNKSGKTAGGDIVRRLPNIATALSDADFVGSVLQDVSIDADGKMTSGAPIRGKKESMAKAVAEEISLEVFNKELQNENSEISKAFENNQVARGVVLVDNFVEDITRQSERGTVKFSATFVNKSPELITEYLEGIRSEEFKNTFLMLLDEGSENPLKEALIEYFTDFPGLTKKEVTTAAVEFSKDYVFDKKEVGVTRVVKLEGKEATLDYVIKQISGDVVRGTSYGDVQRMLEGSISKFDLKTLKDLNKGRKALKKLAYELVKRGFSGNQVFAMLSYSYGPSGLGGFKGVENPSGTGRVTPKKSILTKAELGPVNYDKKGGVENRGALVLSKDDFIQNFLPGDVKKDGKPTGETIAVSNKVAKKDFYTDAKSVWNRLTDLGKKKEARELWELGKGYGENLVEIIKAIEGLDVTSAARRELVTGLFASMSAAGKIPSTVRFYPSRMDGTLLTFAELVKLFGRKDGVVDQGVFEHTKPANRIAVASYIYAITGLKSDLDILEKELLDYDTAMITMGMDIGLRKLKLQSLMGLNYKAGDAVMGTRYAELITTMEAAGITFWDAKTGEVISPAGTFGKELNQEMKGNLVPVKTKQKAINNARSNKWSKSIKKIRVFDFDDTLARTKSNVLYTMPDGTTGKIDAATFAKDAGKMEAEGAQWDFSEFSKVMNGKAGPLLEVAKIIADKRGTKDVFVLTARPADAAGPIQEFLASMGLNIPIENITGLGNGTPKAKADWVVGKVADGYNDFYFADDHTGNVKAVKDALDTFDVKGKVQLAKVKFSQSLDTKFNDMVERHKGVESFKEFSRATAQRRGKKTGKFKYFISPSAEDFRGLTQYKFAGKGMRGEADQKFFEESLMDPYFQGVAALESARQVIKEDTKALLKTFKPVRKKLNKLIKGEQYTYDAAVRVYLWNKAGEEISGLSKRDNKKLNDIVANDPELSSFADGLLLVSKKDTWPAPGEYWMSQTTLSDLNNLTEKTNRKEYLAEFIENVDIIFSEKNLNKVEALYGEASRKAIENSIYAMKSGSNSPNQSGDAITSKWMNWVNSSIGTIMFFNRRSAVLQTLSAANFINWSDNNPAKAALAFANQPQYWKDFAKIFNSDKLKQRRGGLKSDVQEAEIANAAKNSQDKAQAIISYILKIGFTPTQIADSFAISMGGASLYRNRVNTYKKQGLSLKEAETKAFEDFSKLSDEAQQSGDPALVSQQQRSVAGRLILSFQNTTMQYTRLMKKAGQDLINGRGDAKTHISKILYYGAIQNFLFNALSKTAFALIPGFDEEDEEDEDKKNQAIEKKASGILNGMSDSIVRGTGIYGAIFTTLKNSISTWKREDEKGFTGDQTKTIIELANLAPAIGSKLRKVYSSIQTKQFDRDIIEKHPWDVTIDGKFNPSSTYTIIANLASATFNLPLDRALAEARSVGEMLDDRNSKFQRIALALGWRTWNVGAKNEEFDLIKAEGKVVRAKEGKEKAKKTRAKNKEKEKQRVANLSPAEALKERRDKAKEKKRKALAKRREKLRSRLTKNKK